MGWAVAAEATAADGGSGYWQLAMIVAAIGFLGFIARWRKSRAPALPSVRELRDRDQEPNRYRDAADRAIVELLETSQTLNAQIDTKIRTLNRLVKEAEENAIRLEKLLNEARSFGDDKKEIAKKVTQENPPAAAVPKATEAPKFLSDLHERIYRLRQAGKSIAEIAKATNLSITEVEFIVAHFINKV